MMITLSKLRKTNKTRSPRGRGAMAQPVKSSSTWLNLLTGGRLEPVKFMGVNLSPESWLGKRVVTMRTRRESKRRAAILGVLVGDLNSSISQLTREGAQTVLGFESDEAGSTPRYQIRREAKNGKDFNSTVH